MLTYTDLKKAARLMQQVGDLRPGFLRDGDSCLEGPFPNYPTDGHLKSPKRPVIQKNKSAESTGVYFRMITTPEGELRCERYTELK
jgi:hypothetical protein